LSKEVFLDVLQDFAMNTINLVYIGDLLGHVSIQTTDVYVRADSKQKRGASEKIYVEMKPEKSKANS